MEGSRERGREGEKKSHVYLVLKFFSFSLLYNFVLLEMLVNQKSELHVLSYFYLFSLNLWQNTSLEICLQKHILILILPDKMQTITFIWLGLISWLTKKYSLQKAMQQGKRKTR